MKALARITLATLLLMSLIVSIYAQEAVWENMDWQAFSLYKQERYSEAAKVAEKALKVAESTYGPDHPNVRRALLRLADIYRAQGKHTEVEDLYNRAVEMGFNLRPVDQEPSWSGENLVTFIWIGLTVLGFIITVYSRRRRKEYLKELGAGIGFFLSPKVDYRAFSKKIKWSRLLEWSGLKESEPRKIKYLMQGYIDVAEVAIFERVIYRNRRKDSVTAVLFESDKLSLPYFCLRPEGISQKIGSALGDPDIDFSEFPNFSSQYLLQGAEEEVRKVFNSNILSYFENHPGWTVEGFGAQILVYKRRQSIVPYKKGYQELQQSARNIFQLFI